MSSTILQLSAVAAGQGKRKYLVQATEEVYYDIPVMAGSEEEAVRIAHEEVEDWDRYMTGCQFTESGASLLEVGDD